jgi:hypothetical protein
MPPGHLALIALSVLTLGEAVFIGMWMWPTRAAPSIPATHRSDVTGTGGHGAVSASGPPTGAVPTSRRLDVSTIPSGGGVPVDGGARGTARGPVGGLAAGDQRATGESLAGTVRPRVRVTTGEEVALAVPPAAIDTTMAKPLAPRGWISVNAPLEVRLFETNRLIGTSGLEPIELAPGPHTLSFVNDTVGFVATQSVVVAPGKTTGVRLEMPSQSVAINATPWAEVWVDGSRVGETPIGTLALSLGPHVVVFRHPDLGERTVRTVVRADEPARISVDMRQ